MYVHVRNCTSVPQYAIYVHVLYSPVQLNRQKHLDSNYSEMNKECRSLQYVRSCLNNTNNVHVIMRCLPYTCTCRTEQHQGYMPPNILTTLAEFRPSETV